MWQGMNADTGRRLSGLAHIRQSIRTILTTPPGSRVMRRDFGSNIPALIDAPLNAATRLRIMAATAEALIRWEPRIRLSRVTLSASGPALTVDISIVHRGGAAEELTVTLR
ncbi:MAG: GPW/gp25 family protein [Azoarcus sp.]|jgi:phage baseplate assembly protein W|nr:GPW/gp25 family protein [Azoarcus sp.]